MAEYAKSHPGSYVKEGYFKTWGTLLGHSIGVPIGVPSKKYRPELMYQQFRISPNEG